MTVERGDGVEREGAGERIRAIRERHGAATPGPWAWRGYTNGSVELRTVGRSGQRIVTTCRSEPCVVELLDGSVALTFGACESCQAEAKKSQDPWLDYRCPKESNLDTVWLRDPDACVIKPANTWAVQEVDYRTDVADVAHPDAALIAHAPADIAFLLDYAAQVEEERDALRAEVERLSAALLHTPYLVAGVIGCARCSEAWPCADIRNHRIRAASSAPEGGERP